MPDLKPNIVLSILLGLSLLGCARPVSAPGSGSASSSPSGSDLPITKMQLGSQQFDVEIATSHHDQEVGLMHRDSLPDGHGMIFTFPDEEERTFWNHDVHFGLDLVFADAGGAIVSIKHMKPYSDLDTSSGAPAKYAIELNDGTADKLGLKVGDRLTIPKDALNPPASK